MAFFAALLRRLRRSACMAVAIAALGLHAFAATSADAVVIDAYVRDGCPHCDKAKALLAQLQTEQPELTVRFFDVQRQAAALER